MAPDACAAAPRAPHVRLHVQDTCKTPPLLPHVRMHAWGAFKKPHQYTHVDQHASVACAETPRAWSIHLVLLHVRLHVLLPCTATPRASVDIQMLRWPPRGTNVTVAPEKLSFRRVGQKLSFVVRVKTTEVTLSPGATSVESGYIVWSDGKRNVTSPLVVTLQQPL
ncbi:hypothetical protein DY000_02004182 [Brassica cretica]|uniref:Subtilisin-like protease fibronectin type-III domain-containing protein n=1 Tax=Brassica cretica TaxID=69181 RepID=A0ABQ7C2G1_BRACR|nr:hypothetical protein DY000_02004182 [Brassica cretica]